MTQLTEQQQKKHQDVIEAGRGAYRMDIAVNGNPHSKQPYRDLWDKGWRLERRKDDAVRQPRETSRPPFRQESSNQSFNRPRQPKSFDKRNRFASSGPVKVPSSTHTEPQLVITEKLIDRFNRRHQTKA